MELKLTVDETDVLRTTLSSVISDLRMEVADTDRKGMRDDLKYRERTLVAILARLSAPAAATRTPEPAGAPGGWPYEPPPDVDRDV